MHSFSNIITYAFVLLFLLIPAKETFLVASGASITTLMEDEEESTNEFENENDSEDKKIDTSNYPAHLSYKLQIKLPIPAFAKSFRDSYALQIHSPPPELFA